MYSKLINVVPVYKHYLIIVPVHLVFSPPLSDSLQLN